MQFSFRFLRKSVDANLPHLGKEGGRRALEGREGWTSNLDLTPHKQKGTWREASPPDLGLGI